MKFIDLPENLGGAIMESGTVYKYKDPNISHWLVAVKQ